MELITAIGMIFRGLSKLFIIVMKKLWSIKLTFLALLTMLFLSGCSNAKEEAFNNGSNLVCSDGVEGAVLNKYNASITHSVLIGRCNDTEKFRFYHICIVSDGISFSLHDDCGFEISHIEKKKDGDFFEEHPFLIMFIVLYFVSFFINPV